MKAKRPADALEQLQALYERYSGEGKLAESDAVAERIHAIDPKVELRAGTGGRQSEVAVGFRRPRCAGAISQTRNRHHPSAPAAVKPAPPAPKPAPPPPPVTKPAPPPPAEKPVPAPPPAAMEIETTGFGDTDTSEVSMGSLTIEPTSFGDVSLDAPVKLLLRRRPSRSLPSRRRRPSKQTCRWQMHLRRRRCGPSGLRIDGAARDRDCASDRHEAAGKGGLARLTRSWYGGG